MTGRSLVDRPIVVAAGSSGECNSPNSPLQDSPVSDPAEFLEWDSKFFGRRIARVHGSALTHPDTLLEWCTEQRIDCLYFLAANNPSVISAAEGLNFALMDIRVTYERPLTDLPGPTAGIREARPADV